MKTVDELLAEMEVRRESAKGYDATEEDVHKRMDSIFNRSYCVVVDIPRLIAALKKAIPAGCGCGWDATSTFRTCNPCTELANILRGEPK